MRNRAIVNRLIFAFALAAVALKCAPQRLAGGSEIGNPSQTTLVGSVVYSGTATPAARAEVRLRPKLFTKDTTMAGRHQAGGQLKNTLTDSLGGFFFDAIDTGAYCIEIADGKSNGAFIQCDVAANGGPKQTLPVTSLKPVASIQGTIPVSLLPLTGTIYVQVYGLDRIAKVGPTTGKFTLSDVPEGSYALRFLLSASDFSAKNVSGVSVHSGSAEDIGTIHLFPYGPWAFSKKIILNTTPSGAAVAGTVTHFPVLIRLTADIVDFSSFASAGADIRFAKSDSTPLPFEIARWDVAGKSAELWVTMDTVRGNDSAQCIMMYYGNPWVSSVSSGAAAFGGNGFIAVWHLDGNCVDASGSGHDGVNYGSIDTAGIMGRCAKFNGGDSITIPGLLGTPATLTLSAWVKTDTTAASGQDIVSLGDAALIREDEVVSAYGTGGYAHRYTKNGDTTFTKVTSGQNIAKTGWRYIAFSFDNEAQVHSLYIDGAAVRVDSSAYPIDYTGVGVNTFIGAHGNNKKSYNNRGLIDEVRVCAVARSGDWIRLCFMNQRTDDKLVAFK